MSSRGKKLFIFFTIVVPFLIYSIIYYAPIIRNAPFKAAEFVSLTYKWGVGEHLDNTYNSATGEYRYLDRNDSLVVKQVKLTSDDIQALDKVAHIQGFWNLPAYVANNEDVRSPRVLRYEITFHYKRKSKNVTYMADFKGSQKMKDAFVQVQKSIEQVLVDAEQQQERTAH